MWLRPLQRRRIPVGVFNAYPDRGEKQRALPRSPRSLHIVLTGDRTNASADQLHLQKGKRFRTRLHPCSSQALHATISVDLPTEASLIGVEMRGI